MCSADDKQVEKNISPCIYVLTQKPLFPCTHIHTSAFLKSCYLEFQVLGGSEGKGGRKRLQHHKEQREECVPDGGALSPQVRLSDLCDHLAGLLQRLDTRGLGGKFVL